MMNVRKNLDTTEIYTVSRVHDCYYKTDIN